ncbi:YbaB/EbfC family nucleoid-associated protein [Candidatus Woesebacteria bacterium]|nr:YbaB/EbfC family nucleoid-associated protein [Candidatus Woesebacteria bacterium]
MINEKINMAIGDKFGQLKQLNQMRQQAKELQKELEKEEEVYERGGIRVKVNGAQEIKYIEVDGESQEDLVDALNKAMKNVQKKAAKKMMEMGGGLGGLFGGN